MTIKVTRGCATHYMEQGTISYPANDRSPSIQLAYAGDETGIILLLADGKEQISHVLREHDTVEIAMREVAHVGNEKSVKIPLGRPFKIERF